MKAFIVAALLVASVASQSMDLMDLVKQQRGDSSLLKFRPTHHRMSTVEDLLLKEKLGRHVMDYNTNIRDSIYDVEDVDSIFGRGGRGFTVLPLEELVSHQVYGEYFREFLTIPLFRQFLEQHPVAFRSYLESRLFQIPFLTAPQKFMMYFRNPVFFYKYIVPQVQIIAQSVVPTTEGGLFDYGTTSTSRFNGPYTTSTFGYSPRYNREWSVPMSSRFMGNTYPMGTNTHYYKYLLEKMMNHMNVNKMGQDISETFTDVKMGPYGNIKEQTVGEFVDPITGMEKVIAGDVKLVDEKIVPVHGMDFPYGIEGINKIYGDKKVLSPEMYEILTKKTFTPEIFGKKVYTPELFGERTEEDVFNKYNVDYEPFTYNKYNKINRMNPFITRMLKNNKVFPKMDMGVKTMEKLQVEKMIEEIQKEKIMSQLIKNKEHKMFNIDSEIPTMTQGRFHIPLTFEKPVVGSTIEKFEDNQFNL